MPRCCAVNCSNVSGTNRSHEGAPISYHRFPQTSSLRTAWTQKINRKNWTPSIYSVVCSSHFTSGDFELDMVAKVMGSKPRRKLKDGAIPTLLLPGEKSPVNSDSSNRLSRRKVSKQHEKSRNIANTGKNVTQRVPRRIAIHMSVRIYFKLTFD